MQNEVHSRVDFRTPGIPHSTVQQVETNRKETVERLIEHFENHPNRNMLMKDFEKSEEINHSSQESEDLITDVGNTEIFKFHETFSKRQTIGVVSCTCGKCVQPSEESRQFNNVRFDILSVNGYVVKKNQSRGARHGPPLRQTMHHQAREC